MNIEEVAFKDRKNLTQLNENDLLDIIEFLQNDRKQWINQFTQIHNESVEIQKENQELKQQLETYKKLGFKHLQDKNNNLETQQKEFIKYLEDEKDRLARECSNIYEDSLGHIRLVNEDIFDEVNDILQKYKSIIGVSDENNKQ